MSDAMTKLRILYSMLRGSFSDWRKEVWQRDLDERYCCDGHMCGCYSVTIRELYRLEKTATQPSEEG